ncbi:MAG: sigma-54-dependent transcriptional regulator, partial [Methyloligellaceae bacterium]
MVRMLIIDDDASCRRTLELHFGERGFAVVTAQAADEGLARLAETPADVVISDIRMPGRDGLSLLEELRERSPNIPVVMITAFQDLESTVAALHRGAVDYVGKPIDLDELDAAVDRALAPHRSDCSDGLIIAAGDTRQTIVGRTRCMQEVFNLIGKVSQSRVTVLVAGESGTGKELIARVIHGVSENADEPFIAVNCAALVETLLESELFGHERGSFTGAVSARKGKAELAGGGVLFLDEVSQLSPRMQG